jgi:hypothetical protein
MHFNIFLVIAVMIGVFVFRTCHKAVRGLVCDSCEEVMNKIIFTEKETAEYIGMSRGFLRQDRMNGYRENRTPGPKFFKNRSEHKVSQG